jgi:hypothetical protein
LKQGIFQRFREFPAIRLPTTIAPGIEGFIVTLMDRFKRNQLEEAIVRTLHADERRANELKQRIKRLLVTDRRLGRKKGSKNNTGDRFAFHGQDPPGSGVEVMFSPYEAFAVCAGLILLEHGIPQGAVVSILRGIRSDLEFAHRESFKDPRLSFDPEVVRALAKPGMIATDNSAPVFVVLLQVAELAGGNKVRALVSVCRGFEAWTAFVKQHGMPGFGTTTFEFVSVMHRLAANLSKTRPTKRGRAAV